MSDILIKGMELPKEGRVSLVAVFSDGDVKYIDRETFLSFRLPQKAIEVPTHGRLIDADILRMKYEYGEGRKKVDESPTVLGASKERK